VGAHPQGADAATSRVELADIVRLHRAAFCAGRRLSTVQYRALRAIEACRTAALGGHVAQCDTCGVLRYCYHSCRNRHCPKCQTLAKERWLAARQAELLPVPYFHLVFTLPHVLNTLAQGNPRPIYHLLFQAAADTLLEFGENPRWLGGQIAATLVLHTWGQNLGQHLHVHALVSAGALHADGRWIHSRRGFLFPVQALSPVFRGKFLAGLKRLWHAGSLRLVAVDADFAAALRSLLHQLRAKPWVVYAKQPFAGPKQVLDYLGRYTHRVAISNHRLLSLTDTDVRFRYKDYAHGNRRKVMALPAGEFIRRFLLHVLPTGFMRIRHYGLLANRTKRAQLAQARAALDCAPPELASRTPESVPAFWLRVAQRDITLCPHCRTGHLHIIGSLPRMRPPAQAPPPIS
jgi:Putative transposase/Transposase zinc-binding domain